MKKFDSIKWGRFPIGSILDVRPGKRLTKTDMREGKYPFIGASDTDNGITGFVANTNNSLDSNVLGVNYNGSVVESFYHPYECLFSDDVKRFSLKGRTGNKYIYLFLKSVILMQKEKYRYGYKFNESRMINQVILLPVNSKGNPDYDFMEKFMREKEYVLISRYRERLNKLLRQNRLAQKIKHSSKTR